MPYHDFEWLPADLRSARLPKTHYQIPKRQNTLAGRQTRPLKNTDGAMSKPTAHLHPPAAPLARPIQSPWTYFHLKKINLKSNVTSHTIQLVQRYIYFGSICLEHSSLSLQVHTHQSEDTQCMTLGKITRWRLTFHLQ